MSSENKNIEVKSQNKNSATTDKNAKSAVQNRFLTRFVCIFLAVVLVFGGAMAVMVGIREARAVVKYENVSMDEGVTKFFISRFKTIYLASLNSEGVSARDTKSFWASLDSEGVSYGERFQTEAKSYLASIVAANRIFKTYSALSADDKSCISKTVAEVLNYMADGSVEKFNKIADPYGFDYGDFERATEMLYCAEKASMVIYGTDGSNLSSSPELCAEYLNMYSHVHLAFVRTETKLVITEDESGKLTEQIYALTAEEKAERAARIEEITTLIENRKAGNDEPWISLSTFEHLQKSYDSDPEMLDTGYYFKENATYTAEFREEFSAVVDKAYEMKIGEYARVDLPIGVCFIYRDEPDALAYADSSNVFLSDFYQDGADYFYAEALLELSKSVEFKALYDKQIDPVSIPKNTELYVRSWVS